MNDARFNYLLERYISKKTTREEEEELKELILTGRYQDHFREDLARYMEAQIGQSKDLPAPADADQLYRRILGQSVEPAGRPLFAIGWWLRIAALLILGLGTGWWLIFSPKPGIRNTVSETSLPADEEVIVFSKKDFIRLPDGSTVLLNEDSELTYSLPFGEEGKREVNLKGEAFFDISPNKAKPFVVRTGKISTNVLGTAFNINAREKNIVVTVERGLVRVDDQKQILSLVRPDERLVVNTQNHQFEKTEIKVQEEVEWKSQNLVFDDISLKQTVDLLQDHFRVSIQIDNPDIENCRISAWFLENESLDEILEMVCGVRQALYTKKDNIVTISGGIACN